MKKNNLFKVSLITIGVLLLLTWILPVAAYSGSYMEQGKVELGILDLLSYSGVVFQYFGNILLFLLAVGIFYGVLYKTPVYRTLLDTIVKAFKKKETIFIISVISILAVITSVFGLSISLLAFFPLIISLIILMGYNKIVAISTTVGGVIAGLIGTTFGVTTVDMLNQVLSSTGETIDIWTEFLTKVILLVIAVALVAYNTTNYAKKIKKVDKEEADFLVPEEVKVDKKDKKKKSILPLIIIIDAVLLITLLGFFPWESVFEITIFTDMVVAIQEFTIGDYAIFAKILGNSLVPFGYWTYMQVAYLLLLAALVIALVYKVKFNDMCMAAKAGMKKAFVPILFTILIYVCLVITTYHPFQLVIANFVLTLTDGFNVATTTVVALLASLFNVEMLYVSQSTVPFLMSLVDVSALPLVQIIFQSMYGLVMLIAPTSVVLVVTLAYTKVSYFDWWKYVWRLFVELLLVLVVVFTIIFLI